MENNSPDRETLQKECEAEEVFLTSDFRTNNMVAQRHQFIRQAYWKLNLAPLKLLKFLISCIDVKNPRPDRIVVARKRDLYDFVGATGKGQYALIKEQLGKLITPIELIDSRGNCTTVALLTKFKWDPYNELVLFYFDKDVWPYLTELSKETPYLQYNIMQIQPFKNKGTLILYELLLSYARETQPLFTRKKFRLSVEQLRINTGTISKYKDFKDFEKNMLIKAKEEINSDGYLEFLFTYEKKKEWKEVVEIEFTLRTRTSINDTEDYVEFPERLDDDF